MPNVSWDVFQPFATLHECVRVDHIHKEQDLGPHGLYADYEDTHCSSEGYLRA